MTNRTAVGWECKKHFMRQISDGWVVSFVVHTDDSIPEWFTNARVGTPMDVAVELKDHDKDMQSAPSPAPEDKRERRRFEDMKPSQQAGILCADPEFWEYLSQQFRVRIVNESCAATELRERFRIASRSELNGMVVPWGTLVHAFRNWQRTDKRHAETLAMEG